MLLVLTLTTGFLASLGSPVTPAGADGYEAPGDPVAFRSISAGAGHTCAVLDDVTVKCWGFNGGGQLGQGTTLNRGDSSSEMGDNLATTDLGTGRHATAVAAGGSHTCALLDDGTVKCWGSNDFGQLGQGDNLNRGDQSNEMGDNLPIVDLGAGRTATAVTAGNSQSCALLDDGTVKCWGRGAFGILGTGDTASRGDGPGEMGNALPAIDLGTGRTAVSIATAYEHSCALLDNATVKCWGANSNGELGQGDTDHRGDQPGEMGNALAAVDLGAGRTAEAVAVGGFGSTCALLDDGTVKCWGWNAGGQLGQGDTNSRGDQPGEMGNALPVVDLGLGHTATGVSVGLRHACALLDDAQVKCWGSAAEAGQLGQGDTDVRGDQPGEMGDALPTVDLGTGRTATAVTVGDDHTCAVLQNAALKCWGSASGGRLGLGSFSGALLFRGDAPNEMGDFLPLVNLGTRHTVGPHARLGVTVTADSPAVVVGQPINYLVTVTNLGGVALTGVEVDGPDVADCTRSVADVPIAGALSYGCSYGTVADDVPQMTNQVLVTTDQGVFGLSGTRRTRVDAAVYRPDAQIRLGAGALVGNGVYNTTGAGQARATTVGNLGTGTFTVRVENDGNTTESFTVQGLGTTSRYTVTYKNGATNITTQVVAGTFLTDPLAPGATQDLTLTIKAKAGTPVRNALSRVVTATSQTQTTAKDATKATVTRR